MRKAKLLHTILWRCVQMTYGIYLKLYFRTKVIWHTKAPKGAVLLVANHSNRNDPFIMGVRLRTPINYMANIDGVTGFREFFATGIGCFNIKKGRADRQAFLQAMQLVKNGYSVGIFPEGDRNWFGETAEFSTAAASLAKKMKVPVVMARFTGNYLSRPRWSDLARRGKILIEFDLIPAEEVAQISKDDIHNRIADYIKHDDINDEKLKDVKFTGKNLAAGIENVLWKCPVCGAEDEIVGIEDTINCLKCEAEFDIDGNQRVSDEKDVLAKLSINNVKDWYNWQLEEMKKQNTDLTDSDVELITETSENVWSSLGKGNITLNSEGITWKNNSSDETRQFPMSEIMNIVDNFNEYAILNLNHDRYKIVFNNTCSYKWTSKLGTIS